MRYKKFPFPVVEKSEHPDDVVILLDKIMHLKQNNFKGTLTISFKDGIMQGNYEERWIKEFNNK